MFLKKFFNFSKDYSHYLERADRYLAAERFAEARIAYVVAMEKIEASGESAPSQIEAVRQKIALTGNMLGRLNLVEAQHALSGGDRNKAEEHLRIIMDLADDATLRESAEKLMVAAVSDAPGQAHVEVAPDCVSCRQKSDETGSEEHHDMDDDMTGEDRLALYFQTLPGDLPERYAAMGEDFARGCLLNLEGSGDEALGVFEELSADAENDILDYEKAILYFHNGNSGKCEQLLVKAIAQNRANPLCNIGLVQLYTEIDRIPEALRVLERMISTDVVAEQARLMQGDLYALLGDEANAIESYSKLLTYPKFAREAAERLVPLLKKQGRTDEAAYLAKKFAKGCC